MELNEEWNNFMQKINEVSGLVRDMAGGDKQKADAAKLMADRYLADKDIVIKDGQDIEMRVKSDRTVINKNAFRGTEAKEGEMDKYSFMASVEQDAAKRAQERKVRRERADTLKLQAARAFRREEYDRALSYYNKAMEQIRDDPTIYCDRALTNIKLGNYQKIFADCDCAVRLNERSFKARLYTAKAHLELEDMKNFEQTKNELDEMFPQHKELIDYFLTKKVQESEGEN